MRLIAASIALLTIAAPAWAGEKPPHLSITTLDQMHWPPPAPYRPEAKAGAEVDAALARAKARGVPLLIDFGANWCLDCRVLAGIFDLPEMRGYIARNFEVATVDIGRFNRNFDIAQRYGFARLDAVPAVFIVDSKTGKLRNRGDIIALGDARTMAPQAIADWLGRWTK